MTSGHAIPIALLALAAVAGAALAVPTYGLGLLLFGFALLALLAYAGADRTRMAVALLAAVLLGQFLKRALFVIEPSPAIAIYYGLQFLPTVILCLGLLLWLSRPRAMLPTASSRLLLAFWGLALATTLVLPFGQPLGTKLSAIQLNLVPVLAYFLAVRVPPQRAVLIGRAAALLAVLGAAYGLLQFLAGPTLFDEAWARALATRSLQASKVYDAMLGFSEFRAYSSFSDPLDYGLFLVCGLGIALSAGRELRWSGLQWLGFYAMIALGLLSTLSRSPMGGLLVMMLAHVALSFRGLRRPWVTAGALLAGAFLTVVLAQYLLANFGDRFAFGTSAVEERLLTVGTLADRVEGLETFFSALGDFALFGRGYSFAAYFMDVGDNAAIFGSHNFLVSLLTYTGLPGLALFLGAIVAWLFELAPAMNHADPRVSCRARWLVALVFGLVATGYVSSTGFMTYAFYVALGLGSGLAASLRAARPVAARRNPASGGSRLPQASPRRA
ncbi:O-Antigen ligase [Tistlia consotensis]|uniref:O-Antigen ligase n=1 Tax=Tistlia consotensis USBA 355 TaxID=560819 RepID=A0A1Y6BNW6_9PROT|nr:O-antigen ligase family protein [Tistlia consotensis]SMF21008.1 O-Antigen ligase [Tistlia consotensis USBA 355]SNR47289.1 O-Antigen ligase [Tistlia consotensis]